MCMAAEGVTDHLIVGLSITAVALMAITIGVVVMCAALCWMRRRREGDVLHTHIIMHA